MKAKSFIVALVVGFAAVMVAAVMATSAKAGPATHPSVTIAADVVVSADQADDESTEPADDEVSRERDLGVLQPLPGRSDGDLG